LRAEWGDEMQKRISAVVPYLEMKCPKCGARRPHVQKTEYPIRYHKCRNPKCRFQFMSYDSGPRRMPQDCLGRTEALPERQPLDSGQQAKPSGAFEGITLRVLAARNGRNGLSAGRTR